MAGGVGDGEVAPAGGVLEGDETLLSEDAGLGKGHEREMVVAVNSGGAVGKSGKSSNRMDPRSLVRKTIMASLELT